MSTYVYEMNTLTDAVCMQVLQICDQVIEKHSVVQRFHSSQSKFFSKRFQASYKKSPYNFQVQFDLQVLCRSYLPELSMRLKTLSVVTN